MKLTRPPGCEFQIGDATHRVPPLTRGQMRRCLEIDAQRPDEETPVQMDARRAAQVAILCELAEPALPLDFLTADEEVQILTALVAQHHGLDPAAAVATANALKKNAVLQIVLASLPTSTTPPPNCASSGAATSPPPSASATSRA